MSKNRLPIFIVVLLLFAAGLACERSAPAQPTAVLPKQDATAAVLPTAATQTSPAVTSPAAGATAATLAPASTEATPSILNITITAEGVNLRAGPGTLFPVKRMFAENTPVQAQGRAPGDDWIFVTTEADTGWVSVDFTSLAGSAQVKDLTVLGMDGVQVVHGRVVDSAGKPADGVDFAMVQGSGASERRLDAFSNQDGDFYLYLPADETGEWTVSMVGVECTSSIVDVGCKYAGTFEPAEVQVSLPGKELIKFTYQP
jgi:uncharacterized protein YraI